ncbi:MAG: universal stress protein, partial [Micrococcales bacterium]|nr:universal stress protein [Micrococcales bacterium]
RSAEHSAELLEAGFDHAAATGASLEVVHAWDLPDAYANLVEARTRDPEWLDAGTRFIEHELDGWRERHPDVPVTVRVVYDRPSRAISAAGAEAELVVLVRRPMPAYFGAHLGSTARAVLRGAACPVLIVPPHPREKGSADPEIERAGELLR